MRVCVSGGGPRGSAGDSGVAQSAAEARRDAGGSSGDLGRCRMRRWKWSRSPATRGFGLVFFFFSPSLRVPSPSPLATTRTPGRAPQGGHSVSCALRLQGVAVPPPGVSSAWGLRAASALPFPVPPASWRLFTARR